MLAEIDSTFSVSLMCVNLHYHRMNVARKQSWVVISIRVPGQYSLNGYILIPPIKTGADKLVFLVGRSKSLNYAKESINEGECKYLLN